MVQITEATPVLTREVIHQITEQATEHRKTNHRTRRKTEHLTQRIKTNTNKEIAQTLLEEFEQFFNQI